MDQKPKDLRRSVRVVFIAKLFPDGSGDFSFSQKFIDLVLANGFDPDNVYVVTCLSECDQLGKEYLAAFADDSEPFAEVNKIYTQITPKHMRPVDQETLDVLTREFETRDDPASVAIRDNVILHKCFGIGLKSLFKFLVNDPRFGRVKFSVVSTETAVEETAALLRELPAQHQVVITFNLSPAQKEEAFKSFGEVATINLGEGGGWNPQSLTFASGVDFRRAQQDTPDSGFFDLGINIPALALAIRGSEFGEVSHRYHVAYMPFAEKKMTYFQLVGLFRFIASAQLIQNQKLKPITVLANKSLFAQLKSMIQVFHDIDALSEVQSARVPFAHFFANARVLKDTVEMESITVGHYAPMPANEFQSFLARSERECIVTGDQSFYEAIAFGKIALYDIQPHKYNLYNDVMSLFSTFMGRQYTPLAEPASNELAQVVVAYDARYLANRTVFWTDYDPEMNVDFVKMLVLQGGSGTPTDAYDYLVELTQTTLNVLEIETQIVPPGWTDCASCKRYDGKLVACQTHKPEVRGQIVLQENVCDRLSGLQEAYYLQAAVRTNARAADAFDSLLADKFHFEKNIMKLVDSRIAAGLGAKPKKKRAK